MTKAEMQNRIDELVAQNERLGSQLQNAINLNRTALAAIKAQAASGLIDGYVPVPLTVEQKRAIYDDLAEAVCEQHGEGRVLSSYDGVDCIEIVVEPRDLLLPTFGRYVCRYSYSDQDGTDLDRDCIWGLAEVK